MNWRSAGVLACAVGMLCVLPAVAAPAVNFVVVPSDWETGRLYWDTKSLRRDGDLVAFDTLDVSYSYSTTLVAGQSSTVAPMTSSLDGTLSHNVISCGLRVAREAGPAVSYGEDGKPAAWQRSRSGDVDIDILYPDIAFTTLVDTLCAGQTPVAKGSRSLVATMKAAKKSIPPPTKGLPAPLAARPDPVAAAWMSGAAPAAFVEFGERDADGVMRFLDRTSMQRSGDRVTGLSLLILGEDAHRRTRIGTNAVVLRRTFYDCAARTLTVLSQARWTKTGELDAVEDLTPVVRAASESPLTAQEISAACASELARPPQPFASVEDAWAHSRTFWSPLPTPAWTVQCLWSKLPSAQVNPFLVNWAQKGQEAITPELMSAVQDATEACGVPKSEQRRALNKIGALLAQRAALYTIARYTGMPESEVTAIWDDLTWAEQQRIIRMSTYRTGADRKFMDALVAREAARIDLSKEDAEYLIGTVLFNTGALLAD